MSEESEIQEPVCTCNPESENYDEYRLVPCQKCNPGADLKEIMILTDEDLVSKEPLKCEGIVFMCKKCVTPSIVINVGLFCAKCGVESIVKSDYLKGIVEKTEAEFKVGG